MREVRAISPAIAQHARTLLAESLVLWQVGGIVSSADPPALAEIRATDGSRVRVEPAACEELPIRWWVRWTVAGANATERRRPCTSVVGLLRTVRSALGAEGGPRLHIAPPAAASQ